MAALKRLMIDTMARKNDFAALRAIDMIARLRGLVPTTAKRSDSLEAALEEMRQQLPGADETEDEEADPRPAPRKPSFDPPMPPELPAAGRTRSRSRTGPPPSPAQARAAATEAARAEVRRRLFRYEHLMARHPELSSKIRDLSDAQAYFDDDDNLLPPELWPAAPASRPAGHSGNHDKS